MKNLIKFFLVNPIIGNAFIVITLVFGILSVMNMKKSFFPELTPKIITINVAYPGASPAEMEIGVTTKIEQALEGLAGIKEITSTSSENSSFIRVEAYEDTDMDELLTDVDNTVNSISSFPVGAEKPRVKKLKAGEMGSTAAFLSLTGPDNLWKLKEKSEKIKNDFLAASAISQVTVVGYPQVEISIEIREDKLLEYELRFDQIVAAVRSNNLDLTGGTIKTKEEEFILRMRARETTPKEISDIVIRATPEGKIIRLSDVANVNFQFSDNPNRSYTDGKRNTTLIINKLPEEDLGAIADFTNEYVKKFNKENSEYKLRIIFQFSDMLQERIDLLLVNGMQGMALVLICLGFFLSIRLSFWVAFGIPVSFLGLFALGWLYGMTINMISLFGMILVVGILVDDGIVIAENIYVHYERGKSAMRAALDGTLEVFSSVVSSVLTTVVAFLLLMFVGGQFEMMREMAFAVVACLLFSLVEALLTLPQHLGKESMLKKNEWKWYKKIRGRIDKFIEWLRAGYARALNYILARYRTMVFIPLFFVFIVFQLIFNGFIKVTFFPNIPFDNITLSVAFKPGERDIQTEEFLRTCQTKIIEVNQELLKEFNDTLITATTLSIGSADGLGEVGPHTGNLRIQIDLEGKDISSQEIAERIRKKIGPVRGPEKFVIGGEQRFGKPVSLMLTSENTEELKEAKEYVKRRFNELGVLKDVTDDNPLGSQEIDIRLKPKAYMLGLTRNEVMRQIRQGFFGDEAQRLIIGEDEVRVWVRYPQSDRSTLGQLENMKIKTLTNELFPIHELVDYKIVRGVVGIKHFNGKQQITIDADLINSDAPASEAVDTVNKAVLPGLKAQFPGVEYSYGGQAKRAAESQGPLGIVFGLTIFFVILILSVNFGSLMQAFIVVTVIPAGIMCALYGHGLEGKPVSLFSAWGIIALIGILVNDAVVMLDTFNRNIKEGMQPKEAAYNAGQSRFRAVILTSVTTVAGLYPLIMEDSFQAQFLIPMAIAVAHGLLWGTMFTLFFFPSVMLFYNDFRRVGVWMMYGKTNPLKVSSLFYFILLAHFFVIIMSLIFWPIAIAFGIFIFTGFHASAMKWIFSGYADMPSGREVEPALRSLKRENKLIEE